MGFWLCLLLGMLVFGFWACFIRDPSSDAPDVAGEYSWGGLYVEVTHAVLVHGHWQVVVRIPTPHKGRIFWDQRLVPWRVFQREFTPRH